MAPLLLHIETSASFCSVGLSRGTKFIALKEADEQFTHAKSITLFIDECLQSAHVDLVDVDAVVTSLGPGSYTGLRVGLSVAKGICYTLDKPLIGVNTLEAVAWGAVDQLKKEAVYIPMIDARRMEVYTAVFDGKMKRQKMPYALVLEDGVFEDWLAGSKRVVFCGNGVEKAKVVIASDNAHFLTLESSAAHLLQPALRAWEAGDFLETAYCEPFYLKRPNITKPKPNTLLTTGNRKSNES